ncbi:putative cytochrome P450 monooxygenase [Thozetella sp. PMI_491]|nr:putative cytochrome P450 monooxygenase [Thozetella sp. PMI_491]
MALESLAWTLSSSYSIAIASIAGSVYLVYVIATTIYNLFFHPLARFPGPLLWRATRAPYLVRLLTGRLPFDVYELHRKFGPVIRLAPNELAFSDSEAWKDIYGHRTGPNTTPEGPNAPYFYFKLTPTPSVLSEERQMHGIVRRSMSHGFSDKSMRDQAPLIGRYVDILINQLKAKCVDPDRKDPVTGLQAKAKMDIVSWYNWTTFDVIGDLAFGEPFGSLEKAGYNPWVEAMNSMARFMAVIMAAGHLGSQKLLLKIASMFNSGMDDHDKRMREGLSRRIEIGKERPDLIEGMLMERNGFKMDYERILANASLLVIAGSETTATLLSGVTYLLLRNPDCLRKATEEVRSTFELDSEISLTSVSRLAYMLACLDEAMRHYPPIVFGMPRVAPEEGAIIAGKAVPAGNIVAVWQYAVNHLDQHFTDPMEYHPERFLGDPKYAEDNLEVVQPFLVGPRNYIGRNLAYAEMRLILARILFNFDLQLVDKDLNWLDQRAFVAWDKKPLEVYLTPVAR